MVSTAGSGKDPRDEVRAEIAGSRARGRKRRDQEVLDAAAKVFHERGYADASVQDVADELGILKGSLYHYIDTKEDLLYRLLEETHEHVSRILEDVRRMAAVEPLERLRLYVARQIEYNLSNIARVAVYYHDFERLGEERRRDLVAKRREHERFVTGLIVEAQQKGAVDASVDAQVASRCVFATIIWTYKWFRPDRDGRDDVVRACTSFALRGLVGDRAPAPAAPPGA